MPRAAQRHAVSNGSTTAATTAATSNPVESSSLDNPVESCSLDVLAVFAPKSIDWAFQFSTSTGAVVVDVCCSTSCDTGNADGAGRASSALALADAVVTDDVLVDDFVVDLGLVILVDVFVDDVDTFHDVVLVDAVVDEVGVLDRTQQVMLLEGFCT